MNFPEKLKELRKAKGITQEELAKAIFVSRTLITKYESGAVYPTKENLEKLALYFGVNISDLVDGNDAVQLALDSLKVTTSINKFINILILALLGIFFFISFLPIFTRAYYGYSTGVTPPNKIVEYVGILECAIRFGNPVYWVLVATSLINIGLSIILLTNKIDGRVNRMMSLCNYLLMVINLVLIFFSIAMFISTIGSNLYDF